MKKTKKIFALLLALVMTLTMSVATFAASLKTGDGSITITNATIGESYTIYKIFDTDSTGAGSITATEDQKTFYEEQENNPFVFTKNTAGSYNVSVQNGVSNAEVIAFLQGFVTESAGSVEVDDGFAVVTDTETMVASSATVKFDNIPYGYYLVTSSLGAVVTVNSTDPDQEVIDKNQDGGSNFTKAVANEEDKVVEIGKKFEVNLNFTATNYDGETKITEYTITDTIPSDMDLVYETDDSTYGVKVTVGNTIVNNANVEYKEGVLTITIPWQDEEGDFLYSSPSNVKVTYTVELNKDAEIQNDIINTANLTWTGESNGCEDTETVQTYALAIMKVDNEGNPLPGATFAVTANGEEVYISQVAGEEGVYVVDPDSETNTVVSPENGLIVIKGVDNIEYTLTETSAPAGYNLLETPVTVTPTATGSKTITIYFDENGNVTNIVTENASSVTSPEPVTAKVVVNQAGSELPSTGGMGTTIIYIAGIALVLGAGITLIVRRRMSADR